MFLNCRISCSSSDFLLFSVSRFLVGVQHVLRLTVFCFSPFFPFSSLQCSRLLVFFSCPAAHSSLPCDQRKGTVGMHIATARRPYDARSGRRRGGGVTGGGNTKTKSRREGKGMGETDKIKYREEKSRELEV